MVHRKGMKIYRLESAWATYEGDCIDLEDLGFDSSMVRYACHTKKPYKGYLCSIVGVRENGVNEGKPKKKITVEDFNNRAISEGKNYAQLQLEETMGRNISW